MFFSPIIRKSIIKSLGYLLRNNDSKVIFYHDIHLDRKYTDMSTHIDLFRTHIDIIQKLGYDIVPTINNPYGQIEIGFDDGFFGIYENINVIKDLNIPVQLFIVSSFLGNTHYIDKDQLLELSSFSQITISSHTHQHRILNMITETEIFEELQLSKDILESLIKTKIVSIAFPEGKFNKHVVDIAKEVGFNKLYSSIPGFYFDEFLPGVKKRSLVQDASASELRSVLKGGDHIFSRWYQKKHYNL